VANADVNGYHLLQLATSIKVREMTSNSEEDHRPASDWGHSEDTTKRRPYWYRPEDRSRWEASYRQGNSIVQIAAAEQVSWETVSKWLHRLGVEIKLGRRPVQQPPLGIPPRLVALVGMGHSKILRLVREQVWGIDTTPKGIEQLRNFCQFVHLHGKGVGVKAVAKTLGVHRSTILKWRQGINQPYLAKVASSVFGKSLSPGWKLLPLRITSGGNEQKDWIRVPESIHGYNDILSVIRQTKPLEQTYDRAAKFGLSHHRIQRMRHELFAYLIGMMLGDSGKLGGKEQRFSSMHLDLQLTKKKPSNYKLGDFVCTTANSLGFAMNRIRDKQPSGATRTSRVPTPAYRWMSERSPLLAWMFSVGLGLKWNETTTLNTVRMDWILETPYNFRKRFIQAVADSDGTVRPYSVEIVSVPNTEFIIRLLRSLGMTSAHARTENGKPLRSVVTIKEAAKLPIFNEFTHGYRYQKLQKYA